MGSRTKSKPEQATGSSFYSLRTDGGEGRQRRSSSSECLFQPGELQMQTEFLGDSVT